MEIRAPRGVSVSMAVEGSFDQPQPAPLCVGMLVGPVYRFRVMNIPFAPGIEVFPTVEIVDRLYPPPGQELLFPIPVELTAEELQMAADGKFVTRVIYVENPHAAVPMAEDEKQQSWFDVGPGQSPLKVARNLGRPVAVLRLGGRLPDPSAGVDMGFLCGCPPLVHLGPVDAPTNKPAPQQGLQRPQWIESVIAGRPEYETVQPRHPPVVDGPALQMPLQQMPVQQMPVQEISPTGVRALPPPPARAKTLNPRQEFLR